MARPIEETPILFGEDAKAFMADLEKSNHSMISEQELERMQKNFARLSGKS